jgi:methylglyoxal/glyoxal reductase
MITSISDCVTLNNGVAMPWLGLGVWRAAAGNETKQAVVWALEHGYRHIDTAMIYENERDVGEALRASGVPREEVFVTTKVWNGDQGHDPTLRACEASLERMGMDYVDLYLIHWPVKGKYVETWGAMEALCSQGKARAVGVSNFMEHHLEAVIASGEIVPAVNQVEYHPELTLPGLRAYCAEKGVRLEAWAPIMKGRVNDIPEIVAVAEKHGKTPVQATLRWDLQHGVVTIPKSVHQERIVSNADIFDFELDDEDMAAIDALDREKRIGPHPDEIDF